MESIKHASGDNADIGDVYVLLSHVSVRGWMLNYSHCEYDARYRGHILQDCN